MSDVTTKRDTIGLKKLQRLVRDEKSDQACGTGLLLHLLQKSTVNICFFLSDQQEGKSMCGFVMRTTIAGKNWSLITVKFKLPRCDSR